VAAAIAIGWRRQRPEDKVVLLLLADGGKGKFDVASATPGARRR
jgi:glycerate kinase